MKKIATLLFAVLVISTTALSQSVEVSKTNKTIAVKADDSVSVDPDVAIIRFGYENYGATRDEAYRENLKVSDAIVKAMLESGVPKGAIETGTLRLTRVEAEETWTSEQKRQRQFEAEQAWTVKIPTSQAETLVAIIMKAGANGLRDVDWEYSDKPSLQAQASGAALAKARKIAEQMAKGLGAKLGELVYASNEAPEVTSMPVWRNLVQYTTLSSNAVARNATGGLGSTSLFPKKVRQQATVYAVFAIE